MSALATGHRVCRLVLELEGQELERMTELRDGLGELSRRQIGSVLGRVFDGMSSPGSRVRLDTLELNLGEVELGSFEADYVEKLERALRAALRRSGVRDAAELSALAGKGAGAELANERELLSCFFATGALPWWAPARERTLVPRALREVLRSPVVVVRLFADLEPSADALARLLRHLDEANATQLLVALREGLAASRREHGLELRARGEGLECGTSLVQEWIESLVRALRTRRAEPRSSAREHGSDVDERRPTARPPSGDSIDPRARASEVPPDSPDSSFERAPLRRGVEPLVASTRLYEHDVTYIGESTRVPGRETRADRALSCSKGGASESRGTGTGEPVDLPGKVSGARNAEGPFIPTAAAREQPEAGSSLESASRPPAPRQSWSWSPSETSRSAAGSPSKPSIRRPRPEVDASSYRSLACARRWPPARHEPTSRLDDLHVGDAGLILTWPFLTRLLERVELVRDGEFGDELARWRAVDLLHYIGHGETDAPEYQLVLAKLLCACELSGLPPARDLLDAATLAEADRMLEALADHVDASTPLTPTSLRAQILLRPGILTRRDGLWLLRVERRHDDGLIDRLPWTWTWISLPWMQAPLRVEW